MNIVMPGNRFVLSVPILVAVVAAGRVNAPLRQVERGLRKERKGSAQRWETNNWYETYFAIQVEEHRNLQ